MWGSDWTPPSISGLSPRWATYTPSFWRGANIEWDMKFDKDRASLEAFRGVRPKGTMGPPPVELVKGKA